MKLEKILTPFWVDEHQEIHDKIIAGDYQGALTILETLDEMSSDDKINKIISFMRILLIHLIKQVLEKRTTKSWTDSIEYSCDAIISINKRRRAGGHYANDSALIQYLEEAYGSALKRASMEARNVDGELFTTAQINVAVPKNSIIAMALQKIKEAG